MSIEPLEGTTITDLLEDPPFELFGKPMYGICRDLDEVHRREITNLNKAILRKNHSLSYLRTRVRELEARLKQHESLGDDWIF